MEKISGVLRKLTHDDLREWAGSKIFSRGKSYIRNVDGLSCMEDGTLAAWVSGSEEYATSVLLDPDGNIEYFCTCPYDWGPCKHAVAVVLAAAEQVKLKKEIPRLNEKDDLFLALFDDFDDDYEDDDEYEDDGEWPDEDEEPEYTEKPAPGKAKGKAKIRKILEGMDKEALVSMLIDLTARYPEIGRGMLEKEQLATGQVDKIVSSLRREIGKLTAESAWYNPWKGEGNIPDYSQVRDRLRTLLATGHADAVLKLGEELWNKGQEQVEQSHDEGETATAIAECMEVVLRAVPQSSLTPPEQLLWVIDHMCAIRFFWTGIPVLTGQ